MQCDIIIIIMIIINIIMIIIMIIKVVMITHPGGKPMCPVEDQLCKPGEQDEPHHCDLRSIVMMIVVTMVIMMIIKPSTAF